MDYSYVYLILLLPALSFLILGLLGMKMSHKVAGLIGTVVLGTVFCLSCYTAYEYFIGVGRGADGLYPTITPFNITWLKFTELLTFNIGFRLTPIFCDDVGGYLYGQFHGAHLLLWLYARRERFSALLRFPFALHHVNVGLGSGNQYFPDVFVLGVGGC